MNPDEEEMMAMQGALESMAKKLEETSKKVAQLAEALRTPENVSMINDLIEAVREHTELFMGLKTMLSDDSNTSDDEE